MNSCFENLLQLGILYVLLGKYCVECITASVHLSNLPSFT